MLFEFYEVGGKVRDELLGLESKDTDYVAVPHEVLIKQNISVEEMFDVLIKYLENENFKIFLITKNCFTIRAKFPEKHEYSGVADFVMARKEIGYIENTRTPIVEVGTLYDDLERRDFTLNALAKKSDGTIIDYFNGLEHLKKRLLVTPLPVEKTFNDDPLRLLRAIRFVIMKGFILSDDIHEIILDYDYDIKMKVVSNERIREELIKCFSFDTLITLDYLNKYNKLRTYIFQDSNIWLKPTFELK
jgi:tRNA nucleotidyltransferase/poly(A) polymerase